MLTCTLKRCRSWRVSAIMYVRLILPIQSSAPLYPNDTQLQSLVSYIHLFDIERKQYSHTERARAHNNHNNPPPRHRHTPRIPRIIITSIPPHLPRILLLGTRLYIGNILLRAILRIITPIPIIRPRPAQRPQRIRPIARTRIRTTCNFRSSGRDRLEVFRRQTVRRVVCRIKDSLFSLFLIEVCHVVDS